MFPFTLHFDIIKEQYWFFKVKLALTSKKGGGAMTVYEALTLMLTFGSFLVAFLVLIVALLSLKKK